MSHAIRRSLALRDRATYGKRLKEAADKLGKSKRTVQRLVKKWEESGLAGLTQTKRSDKGNHRINDELQQFILKTYKDGNKGSKRITPKQVFLRTKAKAEELGIQAPSHMTVYRMLNPLYAIALVREELLSVLLKPLIQNCFQLYQDIQARMFKNVQKMQKKKLV